MVGVCSGGHKKPVMNNVMEHYWLWLLFVTPVDMWWMYWWICGGCIRVWIPICGGCIGGYVVDVFECGYQWSV